MPVDIVSTESSPYVVMAGDVVVSNNRQTLHTAIEDAINQAESCKCATSIIRNLEIKVIYTPLKSSQVLVTWDNPTTRSDDSPLTIEEIKGFKVKHNGEMIINVGKVNSVTLTVAKGLHVFEVATVDTANRVSAFSPPVEVTIK